MAQDQLKRLQSLKNRLDSAQMEKSRLEGRLETFYTTLEDYGVKTVKEAEKKIKNLKKKKEELEEAINSTLDKLEKEFDIWEGEEMSDGMV